MSIKELRLQTGLSQSKFANMFGVPVATLKDWEQERRTLPSYVVNMMRIILEYRGMLIDETYIAACERRRKSVEKALAIISDALADFVERKEYVQYQIAKTDYEAFREKYFVKKN